MAVDPTLIEQADAAAAAGKLEDALSLLQRALSQAQGASDEAVKQREACLLKQGALLRDLKRPAEMAALVRSCQTALSATTKAKTTKIIRQLIDYFAAIPGSLSLQVEVVKELMQWAESDNRIYLKQNLETRLVSLYLDNRMYTEALALIVKLLKELKRLDDKLTLVEVHLLESRCYHALRNLAKSRAALTSARTAANAIYCPPLLQAALDMQSGVLHADDKDYKTAYSYFYETLDGYGSVQEDARAVTALKYMLLCKIMLNNADEVHSIVSGKMALRFTGPAVDSMRAVATACKERSLQTFEQTLAKYSAELQDDPIIKTHLQSLYDTLLEQNLTRIIEPYSRVQIQHIAHLIKLEPARVETKLSQMILDKVLDGILDQSNGTLVVFEETASDKTYPAAIDTIKNMSQVVDSLYEKARKL